MLFLKRPDVNQPDLQPYTSPALLASSSNYPAGRSSAVYGESQGKAVRDFNKCREPCMGKVLLSQ